MLFWRVHDYDPWLYEGGLLGIAVCAALLIAIVAHPATRLSRALGSAPLRWIGVRSYGIYLWHWPIMLLTRPGVDVPWHGPVLILSQIAVTFALAALSYRYVEQPIRTGAAQDALKRWLTRQSKPRRLQLASGGALERRRARGARVRFAGATQRSGGTVSSRQPCCLSSVSLSRSPKRLPPIRVRHPHRRVAIRAGNRRLVVAPRRRRTALRRCRRGRSSRLATL